MTPEIFAPGVISTDANEVLIGFFHDGEMCLFERSPLDFGRDWIFIPVYITSQEELGWPQPAVLSPGGKPWFYFFPDAPEGTTIFFAWKKNLDGIGLKRDIDIWRTTRKAADWSEPQNLGSPVNTDTIDSWPSPSATQTLYFFSTRGVGRGKADLYRSRPTQGRYTEVENLGQAVNSQYNDHDPFIAPDESYLLWCSDRPGGSGADDLYISFRRDDGGWTNAIHMGGRINSEFADTRPYVTKDGQYMFFNSTRNGSRDIYWISATLIDELRPKE